MDNFMEGSEENDKNTEQEIPHLDELVAALIKVFGDMAWEVANLQAESGSGEARAKAIWQNIAEHIKQQRK